ncbi:LuxR C-terminal-related transcriptional regulator [Actinomadura viridis]|uniref:helix-turn-helix transcriptional regulator n=1 Tax=Actinomadura viridis TaxID=58110 RepID=UPI0036A2DCE8
MLWGRAAEEAAVAGTVTSAARGAGGALLLRGGPGVGKSALLEHAGATAPPGMRVLRATGAEPEQAMAFAALHQLLLPVTGRLESLPGPQRDAVRGALGLSQAPSDARFLVAAGVLSLLGEVAADDHGHRDGDGGDGGGRGLLCLLDDVQWFDRASLDVLLFAARRLADDRVAMLFAMRADAGPVVRDVPELRIGDLDPDSAAAMLAERAGRGSGPEPTPVAAPVRARIVALTGGNPLALAEAADLLTAEQLAGRAPLPDPLPVGPTLFGDQVARLPGTARPVLLAAAAEGRGDLDLVLRAARRLGGDPAGLEAAEAAGLVEAAGARLRLRHPLVRSAVYAAASPAERRRAHASLAEELARTGDEDRSAWHRAAAATGRDAEVADALAASAGRARERGGYADAAAALARSADLTPDPAVRARRLADAATAAWLGGRPGQAESHLAEARELAATIGPTSTTGTAEATDTAEATGTPRTAEATRTAEAAGTAQATRSAAGTGAAGAAGASLLAELTRLRGRFELNRGDADEARRLLQDGAERVRAHDPALALGLLADASEAAGMVGDTAAIVDLGRRAEDLPGGFTRQVVAGIGAMLDGDTGRGGALLRNALRAADGLDDAAGLLWAAAAASYLGEADASADLAVRAGRVARHSGMAGQLPVVLEFVATAERFGGRFALSAAVADEGLALAREAGYTNSAAAHLANLAAVAAVRGHEDDCARLAREALEIAIPHRLGLRVSVATYALGLLDLGMGRFAAAHARFEGMVTAGPGAGHPTSVWRSTPDRVEAAMACGETDAARAAVTAYERWSVHARTAQSRALLLRCRALLEEEDGKALTLYEEALRLHAAEGDSPYETARTRLLYGERLRRTQRAGDARSPLRAAEDTFSRLGAAPWARRAREELRAAGERAVPEAEPDALNRLTPQELRIARLVAEGASNREVAARLFLSPRTVEYHLYKIYPKLDISSRTELARLVAPLG